MLSNHLVEMAKVEHVRVREKGLCLLDCFNLVGMCFQSAAFEKQYENGCLMGCSIS